MPDPGSPIGDSITWESGPIGGTNVTQLGFSFPSTSTASGVVGYVGYPGCTGTGTASWTAFNTNNAPPSYEGQWSGSTSQAAEIRFVVSADRRVTSITVGYNFSGCSGVKTFSNLNVSVLGTGFAYASGQPGDTDFTEVMASFDSNTTASGVILLSGYTGCTNQGALVSAIWTARRG